jgi:hypothetical protein
MSNAVASKALPCLRRSSVDLEKCSWQRDSILFWCPTNCDWLEHVEAMEPIALGKWENRIKWPRF